MNDFFTRRQETISKTADLTARIADTAGGAARPTLVYSLDYARESSGPDLLTREQAADYLGVAPQTLAVWAMAKNRPHRPLPFVKIGRLVRYRRSDLDAFITANTQ
jgi:excisionase family DNA binding protein